MVLFKIIHSLKVCHKNHSQWRPRTETIILRLHLLQTAPHLILQSLIEIIKTTCPILQIHSDELRLEIQTEVQCEKCYQHCQIWIRRYVYNFYIMYMSFRLFIERLLFINVFCLLCFKMSLSAKMIDRRTCTPRGNHSYGPFFLEYSLLAEYNLLRKQKLPGVYVIPSTHSPLCKYYNFYKKDGHYRFIIS